MHIRFDKIDGFIIVLDGKIKHLILFDYGLFNKFCDKIKYLISKNSINHNFGKIRTDSFNFLPIKKILTFYNTHLLIRINTAIIYFYKKVRIKINECLYITNAIL